MDVNLLSIPQLHAQIANSTQQINILTQFYSTLVPHQQHYPQLIIQILHQINLWTAWREKCQFRLIELV